MQTKSQQCLVEEQWVFELMNTFRCDIVVAQIQSFQALRAPLESHNSSYFTVWTLKQLVEYYSGISLENNWLNFEIWINQLDIF